MNVHLDPAKATTAKTATTVVDCDIHPAVKAPKDLHPFMASRWIKHLEDFSDLVGGPFSGTNAYPRYSKAASRRDAWPPSGGRPGSDVHFMREQHLDRNGIDIGILLPVGMNFVTRNLQLGAALATAVNDWQIAAFIEEDKRLRGSIVVAVDDPLAAIAEIRRCAKDKRYVQVSLPSLTTEPIGRPKYWPIFEVIEELGLPIGMHVGGQSSSPRSAGGWPSYYAEEHFAFMSSVQTQITSMVLEGAFARFPGLKLVGIEGGFGWAPPLCWRLDSLWQRMNGEVPHLTEPPSAYIRRHVYFTTQPMEETEHPDDVRDLFESIGYDRILFSSDYPHWDFDDPKYAFKIEIPEKEKKMVLGGNAMRLYGLGGEARV